MPSSPASAPLPVVAFEAVLKQLEPYAQRKLADLINKRTPRPTHVVFGENAYLGESRKPTVFLAGAGTTLGDPSKLRERQIVGDLPSQQRALVNFAEIPAGDVTSLCDAFIDPRIPEAGDWDLVAETPCAADATELKKLLPAFSSPGASLPVVGLTLKVGKKVLRLPAAQFPEQSGRVQLLCAGDRKNFFPGKSWMLRDGREITHGGYGKMMFDGEYKPYFALWIAALPDYAEDEAHDRQRGAAAIGTLFDQPATSV